MSRREAKTVPVHELPTVLVVGCSRDFVDRCREGAAKTGAIVRATDLAGAETMAATCHPLAMVLTATHYRHNQVRFDELVEYDDQRLLAVVEAADADVLVLALAGADAAFAERVMGCLPSRQARLLRRALKHLGPTRLSDVEEAQQTLADLAAERQGDFSHTRSRRFDPTPAAVG